MVELPAVHDVVLYHECINKEQHGEHVLEIKFTQPVQIRSISIAIGKQAMPGQSQVFKGWARDLMSMSGSRFVVVFPTLEVPRTDAPILEVFPTNHLVLRGKFSSVEIILRGCVLKDAALLIKDAAEQQFGELPAAAPLLPLPISSTEQQQQNAAPVLELAPRPLLPFQSLPAAFIRVLVPAVDYWRQVRLSHSRIESNPPNGCLDGVTKMAEVVLAALRGAPQSLHELLAAAATEDTGAGLASSSLAGLAEQQGALEPSSAIVATWSAIQEDALDMAASWCTMIASARTHTPFDIEVGVAGLCSAILLAACTPPAARFLALTDTRQELAGAAAVRGVLTIRSAPPLVTRYVLGLLELLLSSCPAVACATLLGTYTPVTADSKALAEQQRRRQFDRHHRQLDSPQQNGINARALPESSTSRGTGGLPHILKREHSSQDLSEGGHDGVQLRKRHRSSGGALELENSLMSQGGMESGAADAQPSTAGDDCADDDDGAGLYGDLVNDEGRDEQQEGIGGDQDEERLSLSAHVADKEAHSSGAGSGGDHVQQARSGEEQHGNRDDSQMQEANCDADAAEPISMSCTHSGSEALDDQSQSHGTDDVDNGDEAQSCSQSEASLSTSDAGQRGKHDHMGGSTSRHGAADQHQCKVAKDRSMHDYGRMHKSRHGHDGVLDRGSQGGYWDGQHEQRIQSIDVDGVHGAVGYGGYHVVERGGLGAGGGGAATTYRQARLIARRRAQAVELYSGVVELALKPMREDVADSCRIVLRRLKIWECISALCDAVEPMLAGSVNALLLQAGDFQRRMHKVTTAVGDLSNLVPQAAGPGPTYYNRVQQQQCTQITTDRSGGAQQRPDADAFALQLLLSFRVAEQLAGVLDLAAVHASRLVQQRQQQQDSAADARQRQQQPVVQLLSALWREQADLLCSIQTLLSSLSSCPGGWTYLQAAGPGLTSLAQAISPNTKLTLDGGALASASGPLGPASGRTSARQLLLQELSSPEAAECAAPDAAAEKRASAAGVAAELSRSLQRLVLVAQGVRQLHAPQAASWTIGQSSGHTAAAVQTLTQIALASEPGRQAVAAALGSCPPAVQQLCSIMCQRERVLAVATGAEDNTNELAGLLDEAAGSMHPANINSSKPVAPLSYESLLVPELLLTLLAEPHSDLLQQCLPHMNSIAAAAAEQLQVQERLGPAAAVASFPVPLASRGAGGLGLISQHAAAAAASERQLGVLRQLQGYAAAGQKLCGLWKAGDGSGSGASIVKQLQKLLPVLISVPKKQSEAGEGMSDAWAVNGLQVHEADAAAAVQDAAAASPVRPAWGKDVDPKAAVALVKSHHQISAALGALNLLCMLLKGPQHALQGVLAAAQAAADGQHTDAAANKAATGFDALLTGPTDTGLNAIVAAKSCSSLQTGLEPHVLVSELIEAGALEVLERSLRAGTCALEASNADYLWAARGGDSQDDLGRLHGRSLAASLLLASSTAAAQLLLLLMRADVVKGGDQEIPLAACGLLDAIVCAHMAAVTCHEGLAATAATSTSSAELESPAAAAAAALRSGCGRVQQQLLSSRQMLAVCIACWQRCEWWPDAVGALLGIYPYASPALGQVAAEEAEARAKGEAGAPPAPAPKQGPRQMLAALLALGDCCPEEWPPPGVSQAAARAADAAAAAGKPKPGVAFPHPSHMQLRACIAVGVEKQLSAVAGLTTWGARAESRLVRAALVRLCVRAGSLGGGVSPFLVPLLLTVLHELIEAAIKAQQQIRAEVAQIATEGRGGPAQQRAIAAAQAGGPNTPTLSDGRRVVEVLIPLAAKPGFKAALLESKAVSILAKYLHKLALRSSEEPEAHTVAGLVLLLLGRLYNPDISLMPLAPRSQRELDDTPTLNDGRDVVAAALASAHLFSPANMQAAAALLLGPCPAAGGQGLAQYPRGRVVLKQGALRWYRSQNQGQAAASAGQQQAEAEASALEWAAHRLDEKLAAVPDAHPDFTEACRKVAAALRQLAVTSSSAAADIPLPAKTINRFAGAVQDAVTAAPHPPPSSEDLSALLDTPAALWACDHTAADYYSICAQADQQQTQRPKRLRIWGDILPSDSAAASSLWGKERLVNSVRPRAQARALLLLQARARAAGAAVGMAGAIEAGKQQQGPEDTPARDNSDDAVGPIIPAITAPRRSATMFKAGAGSRKASTHVDAYEAMTRNMPPSTAAAGASGTTTPYPGPPALPRPQQVATPGAAAAGPLGQMILPGHQQAAAVGMAMRPQAGGAGIAGGMQGGMIGILPGMPGCSGMGAVPNRPVGPGMQAFPGPSTGAMPRAVMPGATNLQGRPANPAAMQQGHIWRPQPFPQKQQQQQRPWGQPPHDPWRQQRQQQQQQQIRQPTAAAASGGQDSPRGGGSELLGGLEGSPSYHSSPESVGYISGLQQQQQSYLEEIGSVGNRQLQGMLSVADGDGEGVYHGLQYNVSEVLAEDAQ